MNALLAMFRYELRKSVTAGRVAWWFVLAMFPVLITLLSRWVQSKEGEIQLAERNSFWSILLYVAIPCVCCAMSALLTAGPAVATELEQRSWVYLATRPHGIAWLLLGKFLVATLWAFTAAAAAVSLSVLFINTPNPGSIWLGILRLAALAAPAYSATYLLLGAVFSRRSMVFCVMYTVGVEVLLGSFPAVINRVTVQYRLRSLLTQWLPLSDEIRNSTAMQYTIGSSGAPLHMLCLAGITIGFILLAIALTRLRQFTTAAESDL
ncbi:MAG: hypothetical protein ACK6D0_04425 [Planctomyces sp.]